MPFGIYNHFFIILVFMFKLLIISFLLSISFSFMISENLLRKEKYKIDPSWPKLPKNFDLGQVTGIGIDTSQNVILFHHQRIRHFIF